MGKNFSYKLTKSKTMKIAGMIDTDTMTIDVDGNVKRLSTLLSEFNGCDLEINVKVKSEEELPEPEESDEDDE